MPATTVALFAPERSGQTGLSLELRTPSDGLQLNAGGDALTEDPASSGRFTASVAETWTETLHATVRKSSLAIREGWLGVGQTLVSDAHAELDSATQTKINKIEAAVAGTVTGAGTSTEVFVGPSATLTITVDSSGNRSAVVVT